MRSFIGINFNKEIKDSIADIQSTVRANAEKGRFKHIGNFHLTLKFLGEIEDNKITQIGRVLHTCADQHSSFQLMLNEVGCFKGKNSIHALWLGLSGATDKLSLLFMDIDEGLASIGIPKEKRPYVPHITIAQDLTLRVPFEELKAQIVMTTHIKPIVVKDISLIKSEQIGAKRVYTPVSVFTFK